jgi:hypothetical protein
MTDYLISELRRCAGDGFCSNAEAEKVLIAAANALEAATNEDEETLRRDVLARDYCELVREHAALVREAAAIANVICGPKIAHLKVKTPET